MPKFEDKFVYRVYDESLKGKRVFYSNSIPKLAKYVEENDERFVGTIVGTNNTTYSFHIKDKENYMFVYFDLDYKFLADDDSKRLVTNRELAMWLSRGNGEICISSYIKLSYHLYEKDDELVENVLVRKWCDDGWYKPSRQYLGLGD